ncbi:antirestriction protein ArdA [Undibacterium sp. MH2W]|uniref:antirestriction protein ArdA n=1 Tax=Undibacterium sp. MH2W TaxID=3413044 RepID=UPI003BF3B4E2
MSTFFAQPYSLDAVGFYFETLESYTEKSENLLDAFGNSVEEFEIQFIDGDDCELFSACGINQANLNLWFESIADLAEHEKTVLYYLCSVSSYNLENALDKLEDVNLSEGTLKDVAENLFDEFYLNDVPESVRNYIDYKKFALDCELNGDLYEFDFEGTTWTCTNASSI